MSTSKRLRFEVLRRDNHTCRYCGESAPGVKLVVDHVVPEALGGRSEPENLVAACEPCNSGKTSTVPDSPLVADVAQDALRWRRAMEIASISDRIERDQRDDFRAAFVESWGRWTYGDKHHPFELPNNWPSTIDALIQAGMDDDDITDAVETSFHTRHVVKERFAYFCGVAWNVIRRRQEEARRIVATVSLPSESSPPLPTDF